MCLSVLNALKLRVSTAIFIHVVMLAALFAKIVDALVAAEARGHAWLELRLVTLTTFLLVLAHAHPRLLNVIV